MKVSQLVNPLINFESQSSQQTANVQEMNSVSSNLQQSDSFSLSSFNTQANGSLLTPILGGASGIKMGVTVFGHKHPDLGMHPSMSRAVLGKTGFNMGLEAGIYGGISIIKQGIGLATGKQDFAGAAANVTADVLSGASAGLGASIGSGAAALGMRALGSMGTLGYVAAFAGGMAGAVLGSNLFESTNLRDTLIEKFGSKTASPDTVTA